MLADDDRIQVDLRDLGHRVRELGHAQDQVFERRRIECGRAAESEQERRRPEGTHELTRILVGDGEDAQGTVGEQLGRSASEPEDQQRTEQLVLRVRFDAAGNVAAVDKAGVEKVARINPEGDKTPTLGKERSFFEDLFGNIGSVGAVGQGGSTQDNPN